ncbi:MAG: sulfotransferase [Flavobacteriales bacterium]|nr:sulfotransferase [Flavobacteriales bacterium]
MKRPGIIERALGRVGHWQLAQRLSAMQGRLHVDPSKAILLFASPRGGSTWLEEMLNTIPRTATIWEPLDIRNNPAFREVGFWWRQHIPEGVDWPEAEALFDDLFAGRMLSPYLTQSTTPRALEEADRLVVKFVRGNLLLPWLVERFPLPKPVLLIRHPCAVVASMITHGAWNKLEPVPQVIPAHPHDGLLRGYQDVLGNVSTIEERYASIWCMSNAHVLTHPNNDRAWTTVYYEDLIMDTEATLQRIFAPWGMEVPEAALTMSRKASRTTRENAQVHDPQAQLRAWKKALTPEAQERIIAMVKRFGINAYDHEILPHKR